MLVLSGLVLLACGGGDGSVPEVEAEAPATAKANTPEPAPLPEPLMRQALMCCADLAMEPAMRSYLNLGRALAKTDAAAIDSHAAGMAKELGSVESPGAHIGEIVTILGTFRGAEVAAARASYGEISDKLVGTLETSASGELDLAVAYSRELDHHWLQEGVEPRSPYGDGIHSYSWGQRDEVKLADSAREKDLVNPVP
jgi:hypothetical protein